MNYKLIPVDKFKKEAKRLIKKYHSFKSELEELANSLSIQPTQGTALGNDAYKIRVSIKSKGKGKSGGARIITYVITPQKEVYLLRGNSHQEIKHRTTEYCSNNDIPQLQCWGVSGNFNSKLKIQK